MTATWVADGHLISEIVTYNGEQYAISADGRWMWQRAADGAWVTLGVSTVVTDVMWRARLTQVLHDMEIMHRKNLWFNEEYAEAYRRYREQHPEEFL